MHREREQLSLADALRRRRPGGRRGGLEQIDAALDWSGPARLLRGRLHAGRRGRPAYDPLAMFKALLLGELHGLSDTALETSCGIATRSAASPASRRPSRSPTTPPQPLPRRAARGRPARRAVRRVQRQLAARGLSLKEGRAALDATLVEAQAARRRVGSERGPADPDAAFSGARRGRYGYRRTSTWTSTRS